MRKKRKDGDIKATYIDSLLKGQKRLGLGTVQEESRHWGIHRNLNIEVQVTRDRAPSSPSLSCRYEGKGANRRTDIGATTTCDRAAIPQNARFPI